MSFCFTSVSDGSVFYVLSGTVLLCSGEEAVVALRNIFILRLQSYKKYFIYANKCEIFDFFLFLFAYMQKLLYLCTGNM